MAITESGKDKILKYARLYLGGYELSGDARMIGALTCAYDSADFTVWNDALRGYLPMNADARVEGFQALLNDTTNRSLDRMKLAGGSDQVSVAFGGGGAPAVGDPAYILPTLLTANSISFDAGAGVISADLILDESQLTTATYKSNPHGVLLQTSTEIALTTTNGSKDFGAASSNGWHAILHVLSTTAGNYAFTIEDSANDAAFATLGTFSSDGSAVGAEYLAGSGTVSRYVRVVSTKTAGSVSAVITFARG